MIRTMLSIRRRVAAWTRLLTVHSTFTTQSFQLLSQSPCISSCTTQSLHSVAIVQSLHRKDAAPQAYMNHILPHNLGPPSNAHSQLQTTPTFSSSQQLGNFSTCEMLKKLSTDCIETASTNTAVKMQPEKTVHQLSSHNLRGLDCSPEDSDHTAHATPATTPSTTPDFVLSLAKHGLKETELAKIADLLISIAKDAGQIMLEAEHDFLVAAATKNNTSDLVTKYDSQIEIMVEGRTRAAYPTFHFLGEETFKHGTKLSDSPTFVCDPIDGTLNFSKGVPNCAISLALTLNKKPIVGVVYTAFRGDLYWAIKNQGSYLTKPATGAVYKLPLQPVPPPMPSLRSCLVAVEWGNQRSGPNWDLRTHVHKMLLTDKSEGGAFCKSVRSNGSAALDFCYVAQGIVDCFWEGGVWIWDVCAGWIILEEAGGLVASANPGDWEPTLEGRLYYAVRAAKREEQMGVVEELWGIMGERKFVY